MSSQGALGCSFLFNYNDIIGDGGAGDSSAAEGGALDGCGATCGSPGCTACPGVQEVPVQSSSGMGYRVDAYEVTNGDYRAWLLTNPSVSAQTGDCAQWNTSFQPGQVGPEALAAMQDAGVVLQPGDPCSSELTSGDNLPVLCVDWCDAVAYCAWAKKHLCGAMGGGPLDVTATGGGPYADPGQSEWYSACSNEGTQDYPYPGGYDAGAHVCNDLNRGPVAVGTSLLCEGGFKGLFDMSGNVSEWENACTRYQDRPLVAQNCLRRGGAFWNTGADLGCKALSPVTLGMPYNSTGFRCCSGPN
jgi:sulfatase modifying factor 1